MLEVEVKYRARLEEVRAKLRSLFLPSVFQEEVDIYFQHPCRNFAESDEALRVRLVGGRVEATYKGPRIGGGAKTRLEISVLANGDIVELFKRLGFVEVARIRKFREYYSWGDVTISLDRVEGLGEFVEIEKVVRDGYSLEEAVAEVKRIAAELGLREEVHETYLELYLKYLTPGR